MFDLKVIFLVLATGATSPQPFATLDTQQKFDTKESCEAAGIEIGKQKWPFIIEKMKEVKAPAVPYGVFSMCMPVDEPQPQPQPTKKNPVGESI
jgi:hypothetical protein